MKQTVKMLKVKGNEPQTIDFIRTPPKLRQAMLLGLIETKDHSFLIIKEKELTDYLAQIS